MIVLKHLLKSSSILLRTQSINNHNIVYHYQSVKYQNHPSRTAGDNHSFDYKENLYEKQSFISPEFYRTLGPEYWEKQYKKIQPQVVTIIKMLFDAKSSKKDISKLLNNYLEFRNVTFDALRSDLGCISLLTAISMSQVSFNAEEYQTRIVDFLTLCDTQIRIQDPYMLKVLIYSINKRTLSNIQKNIRQYYRLKYIELVLRNIQKVANKDLSVIISHIMSAIQKDHYNYITKWRFYPLFTAINNRSLDLIKQYLSINNLSKKQQIKSIINTDYLYRLINLYGLYSISKEDGLILFRYMIEGNQLRREDFQFLKVVLVSFTKLPYIEIDQNKQTLRQKLLNVFNERYNESASLRTMYNAYGVTVRRYMIQKFIQDQFHRTFLNLNFQVVDNTYHLLRQSQLKKPVVIDLIWRFFKQDQTKILGKPILNHIMNVIYPQKLSKQNQQVNVQIHNKNRQTNTVDNESNLKIWQVLKKLNINFQKQRTICQRSVDILIEDNIVIEIDGEGHYNYVSNQVQAHTSFRNMHLLLSGYKIIVISMFQYNFNRQTEQLEKLLKEKIDLIRQQGVIYVA